MKHHKYLIAHTQTQQDLRPMKKIMCEPVLVQHISANAEENIELTTQPTIQMFFCGMPSAQTLHSTDLLQAMEGLQDSLSFSFTSLSPDNPTASLPSLI